MFDSRSFSSSFIILLLSIIISIMILSGFYINRLINNYESYNFTIINNIGKIRGSIQRYAKLKLIKTPPQNIQNFIDHNLHVICEYVNAQENTIPDKYYMSFIKEFTALKEIWNNLKKTSSKEDIVKYSENAWEIADNLGDLIVKISKYKLKKIQSLLFIITAISITIVALLIIVVYITVKKGLETASITDPLTKLYNRFYFEKEIQNNIEIYKRYKSPFSAFLFDIDNFKKINDTYGHLIGDKVLKDVADIIQKNIRKTDMAFRYGGEEFFILFPLTNLNDALKIAKRIQEEIKQNIKVGGYPVTISGGIGEYFGENPDEFLKSLDEALYIAKRTGKDKIVSTY